jgi:hypothetical protein
LYSWQDSLDGGSTRRKASTCTGQHKTEKHGHTSMSRVRFEPAIPVFERWKIVRASDRAAVGTGILTVLLLLSLAPQPGLGLGLLHKIRLNFLEASQQFSFLQGKVVSPTPNPHPGGPGLCIYIPQRQGGYPF